MSETQAHGHDDMVKVIWRTCGILSVITIVEVLVAIFLTNSGLPKLGINLFYVAMSGAKAFYIVGTFMHLKFEIKHLIITVLIPMTFLIYALIMLLGEGLSWHTMRIPYH
jgi:cytochrome c oxidase subunit 4